MRLSHAVLCLAAPMALAGPALAGRCLDYAPTRIVWCDDFDNYCTANNPNYPWPGYPPIDDHRCATDGSAVPDGTFFSQAQHWPSACSAYMGPVADVTVASINYSPWYNPPFGLIYHGDGSPAQRHEHDMTSLIGARHPGMSGVNGTDASPLVLRYWGWGAPGTGAYPNSPMYVELMFGSDRAPTDYALANCGSGKLLPVVCQQWLSWQAVAPCPSLSAQVHASLCFGWLAQLDRNPCDLENGRRPTVYHAASFDGNLWYDLRQNVFPGVGDFNHDHSGAWFQMTIKSSVYVTRLESATGGLSEATIPRRYTGPFNKIALGTAPACRLDQATGNCIGARSCWSYGTSDNNWGWRDTYLDTPVLYDGVYIAPAPPTGACCDVVGACSVVDQATCEGAGGRFRGIGTTCAGVLCCPLPFADADLDEDVDQTDFGGFQLCYTGSGGGVPAGCECFNQVNSTPEGIDANDFTAFSNCDTGPNVPWSQTLKPACIP